MRYTPLAAAVALCLCATSSMILGAPRVEAPLSPLSLQMQATGDQARAASQWSAAIDAYESALVADPRNAGALIGLGDVARAQNLPGKAIGYYDDALLIRPDTAAALAGLGEAYVARGAIDRARDTLAQLQRVCGGDGCAEIATLTGAIHAAGEQTAMRPEAVMPRPSVEFASPGNH